MNNDPGKKYQRQIVGMDGTTTTVDVYRVLDAFDVKPSGVQHAIKKLLCAGLRGHKDQVSDLQEAKVSIEKAIAFLGQLPARRVLCSRGCCFECDHCSQKPESPILCWRCLSRRSQCAERAKQ